MYYFAYILSYINLHHVERA